MTWSFNGDRPIYTQLVEQLQLRIVTGYYPPGGRLEPVRELASDAAVNPNTMQRAMLELERQGLVYSQRTAGRFVTEDEGAIRALRERLARDKIQAFLREMETLGYGRQDILTWIEEEEHT